MIPIQGFCSVSEPLFWKKPPLAVFLRACTFSTFSDLGAEACAYSVVTFSPQLSDPEMIQNWNQWVWNYFAVPIPKLLSVTDRRILFIWVPFLNILYSFAQFLVWFRHFTFEIRLKLPLNRGSLEIEYSEWPIWGRQKLANFYLKNS